MLSFPISPCIVLFVSIVGAQSAAHNKTRTEESRRHAAEEYVKLHAERTGVKVSGMGEMCERCEAGCVRSCDNMLGHHTTLLVIPKPGKIKL